MLKKIFIAAIIAVSVLSAQIAAAAPPIDWSKVKRISNKTELGQYVESQKQAGETIIPVILANGLTVTGQDFITLCPSSLVSWQTVANDGKILLSKSSTRRRNAKV